MLESEDDYPTLMCILNALWNIPSCLALLVLELVHRRCFTIRSTQNTSLLCCFKNFVWCMKKQLLGLIWIRAGSALNKLEAEKSYWALLFMKLMKEFVVFCCESDICSVFMSLTPKYCVSYPTKIRPPGWNGSLCGTTLLLILFHHITHTCDHLWKFAVDVPSCLVLYTSSLIISCL